MRLVAPDYYLSFSCIAHRCSHNCCIGWEIDIDKDSLKYYSAIKVPLGERLKKHIDTSGADAHFILTADERCPFLNENGLCDIILEMGEGALCDICTDHPRFRNFYTDRVEIGLGLCCEEAARIILSHDLPVRLVTLDDDGENDKCTDDELLFLKKRDEILALINSPALDISQCISTIIGDYDIHLPCMTAARWAEVFFSLENLSAQWLEALERLKVCDLSLRDDVMHTYNCALKNLMHYFIFRHLPDSLYKSDFKARVAFAALSVNIIVDLYLSSGASTPEELADIARMYSAEIEYSDENMNFILNLLSHPPKGMV